MPYDEALATRVRAMLASETAVEERRMMGGLVFLKHGNMIGGINRDRLMVRVGAESYADALDQPHVGPMDLGGRTPKGFVLVDADGVSNDRDLARWLAVGVTFASALPVKPSTERS